MQLEIYDAIALLLFTYGILRGYSHSPATARIRSRGRETRRRTSSRRAELRRSSRHLALH